MSKENENVVYASEEDEVKGDPTVFRTQKWLNDTYGADSRFEIIEDVDGLTGWKTIYALIRALQIELGITATADNFGTTTENYFIQQFPSGIAKDTLPTMHNIHAIIEGALWCKGYVASYFYEITETFSATVENSIKELKSDAGLSDQTSVVTLSIMKALLSMDQFKLLSSYGGTAEIQSIQRYLNNNYEEYVGIIPCDGLYGREMTKALIKTLQAIEGLSPEEATGTFGPTTKSLLPILSESYAPEDAMRVFNFCLTCNKYSSEGATWTSEVKSQILNFQKKYALSLTGKGDTDTWMSLLISSGNPDRSAIGCDCATILDDVKAEALYDSGYRYVGRYLSGTVGGTQSKAMTLDEVQYIFDAGLRIFAIYQEGTPSLERYNATTGIEDAEKAIKAAINLGIPQREYIYFAIDYDIMDGYLDNTVIKYFTAIKEVFNHYNNIYRVGIYGARNICSRVASAGLSSSSFVSDMSTGFSGNLGYTIPDDWAFDQFDEYQFEKGEVSFALDKNAVSGRYLGFDYVEEIGEVDENITEQMYFEKVANMATAFNFPENISISFTETITFVAPGITVNITAKMGSLFDLELNDDMFSLGTLNIINGEISQTLSYDLQQEIVEGLDASVKAYLNMTEGEFIIFTQLAKEIENGKIHFGVAINSSGEEKIYFIVESYLNGNNVANSASLKIELIMEDDATPLREIADTIEERLEAVTPLVVVTALVIGGVCILTPADEILVVVSALKVAFTSIGVIFIDYFSKLVPAF